jgi:WD40 repeat protein
LNKAVEQKKLEAQAKQTALVAFRAASAEVDRKRQDLQKAFAELNESLRQTKVASKRAIEQEKEARARALSAYALQSIAEDPERAVILGRYALDASMGSSAQTSYIAQEALQNAVLNSQLRATVKMPGTSSIQVAFHPDNQSFATAEWNGEVVVWDLQGRELKRFKTSGGIGSLRYLPSGSHLVIAAYDKLLLHDHTTSKILTSRTNSRIRHFAFDPAASRFAIVYDDRPTQVELFAFDGRLGELTPASPASIDFGSPVAKMDLSPNGGRIAAVTEGQFLKVWDRTIGKFIHDFPAHPLPILDVKFRPGIRNNSEVATSSDDSLIKLWRLGDGLPRLELPTSNLSVFDLAFTQDGRKLVSSNRDNRIRVWDLGRKTVELTLQGPRVGNRISLSRDGTALVSGGEDGTASVWSLVRNEGWLTLPSRSVSISLRDKMAVGARTSLAIYDLQTKKTEKQIAVPDWPSIVAWSPSGKFLAVSGSSGTRLYNPELQEVDTPKLAWAEAIQFSPRNEFFASRSGSMVDVIRLAGTKPTLQSRITIPEDPNIYSLAFDPASKLLAGPSASNALWIWQVRDGALIRKVDPAKDRLSGASFHPDGTSLLVGNWASTAQILDTRSWEKVHELKGHQDYVYDVAYSPDGALIATASNDRSVKLWDSKTRRQLMSLRFEESSAYRVAFSPDGKYLSVGRGSKVDLQYHDTYSVILLNPADLLKFSATRVTRELTPEECLRYFDNPVCPTVQ